MKAKLLNPSKAIDFNIVCDIQEYVGRKDISNLTNHEMLEAWLHYNGIINYTDTLLRVINALEINRD